MVIGAELNSEEHGWIPRNYDWRGIKPLDARTDIRTRLDGKKNLHLANLFTNLSFSISNIDRHITINYSFLSTTCTLETLKRIF
jgi:hypothetical protein